MSDIVLDSSAVIAMIRGELGGELVMDALMEQRASIAISCVNWSEVLTRLNRDRDELTPTNLLTILAGVEIVPFGKPDAEATAQLAKQCPALSLGDRACLSLAASRKAVAWTTDKIWARMNVGAELRILR